jgi:hypothetical protein
MHRTSNAGSGACAAGEPVDAHRQEGEAKAGDVGLGARLGLWALVKAGAAVAGQQQRQQRLQHKMVHTMADRQQGQYRYRYRLYAGAGGPA